MRSWDHRDKQLGPLSDLTTARKDGKTRRRHLLSCVSAVPMLS